MFETSFLFVSDSVRNFYKLQIVELAVFSSVNVKVDFYMLKATEFKFYYYLMVPHYFEYIKLSLLLPLEGWKRGNK